MKRRFKLFTLLTIATLSTYAQVLETQWQEVYRNDSIHTPLELYREDAIMMTRMVNRLNECKELNIIKDQRLENKDVIIDTLTVAIKKARFDAWIAEKRTEAVKKEYKALEDKKKKRGKIIAGLIAVLLGETYLFFR